jgi:hypothetical protein
MIDEERKLMDRSARSMGSEGRKPRWEKRERRLRLVTTFTILEEKLLTRI